MAVQNTEQSKPAASWGRNKMAVANEPVLNSLQSTMNCTPSGFDATRDLPPGFLDFFRPLHQRFTARQQEFITRRAQVLTESHHGRRPNHLPASEAGRNWRIALPEWCQDQRNQMTGPADDAELVVKMLNSGAPGVMIDLEDSMANKWPNLMAGHRNAVAALHSQLQYFDQKRQQLVGIKDSNTVIYVRVRGLHLNQAGIFND